MEIIQHVMININGHYLTGLFKSIEINQLERNKQLKLVSTQTGTGLLHFESRLELHRLFVSVNLNKSNLQRYEELRRTDVNKVAFLSFPINSNQRSITYQVASNRLDYSFRLVNQFTGAILAMLNTLTAINKLTG